MKKYSYDVTEFPFAEVMQDVLGIDSLTKLHKDDRARWDLFKRETDQLTPFHPLYYDSFVAKFEPLWQRFVKEVISPLFKEDFLYQAIPTFRVQIPTNLAVGEFHYDSTYGHQEGALNIFFTVHHN